MPSLTLTPSQLALCQTFPCELYHQLPLPHRKHQETEWDLDGITYGLVYLCYVCNVCEKWNNVDNFKMTVKNLSGMFTLMSLKCSAARKQYNLKLLFKSIYIHVFPHGQRKETEWVESCFQTGWPSLQSSNDIQHWRWWLYSLWADWWRRQSRHDIMHMNMSRMTTGPKGREVKRSRQHNQYRHEHQILDGCLSATRHFSEPGLLL